MTKKLTNEQIDVLRKQWIASAVKNREVAEKALEVLDKNRGTGTEATANYRTERAAILRKMKKGKDIKLFHRYLINKRKRERKDKLAVKNDGKQQIHF